MSLGPRPMYSCSKRLMAWATAALISPCVFKTHPAIGNQAALRIERDQTWRAASITHGLAYSEAGE
jgi:hypothetical protein